MKVRVEEDTVRRLQLTAKAWGVVGWYDMDTKGALRHAIEQAYRAEAEPERAKGEHARFLRSMGLAHLQETRA